MLVVHLNWAGRALRLWAESLPACAAARAPGAAAAAGAHPFAAPADEVVSALAAEGLLEPQDAGEPGRLSLRLPCDDAGPRPSERLAAQLGDVGGAGEVLRSVEVPAVALAGDRALAAVLRMEDPPENGRVLFGHGAAFWSALARFALELLADQRFVPSVVQGPDGLRGAWVPWLHDESARRRVGALLAAMPPVVRASGGDGGWSILRESLETLCDRTVRRALDDAGFLEAIDGRDPAADAQVAWLSGLLGRDDRVAGNGGLLPAVRGWLDRLQEAARPFRLCLRLAEPADADDPWRLEFLLKLEDRPPVLVEAERVWAASPAAQVVGGHRLERPQEFLLSELGRASRVYDRIESALAAAHPTGLDLTTAEAGAFLREHREVLEEAGFPVLAPSWWGTAAGRPGLRLRLEPADAAAEQTGGGLGLDSLVRFRWQVAVGDEVLAPRELERLARTTAPLVRVGERWIENSADLGRAARLVAAGGGEAPLRDAVAMVREAGRGGVAETGLPVVGLDAGGWLGRILDGGSDEPGRLPTVPQPRGFSGTLRPYQGTGLSWLAFLERFGFGACLADDMGLGKTIQLIALLLHEREAGPRPAVGATLLIVPTSLIGNWTRELGRFAPELAVHVHHGPQRDKAAIEKMAEEADVVITTYALVPRDLDALGAPRWRRVVLDEAQYVKNPATRQSKAVRQLRAPRRVALTGTPVENRLAELWSIMEFCNPGYLGSAESFRRRCAIPIERHRDRQRAESLRRLVHPFVLRRVKRDPAVISDLPPCVETKEFATLTPEQAALYRAAVDNLLADVDDLEDTRRRGRVLATLTRLKQICNHPAQLDTAAGAANPRPLSARSGKCRRLMELLEELLAEGDKALVFTQYRRMGLLLSAMIRQDLDAQCLFMHGGTPPRRRDEMIRRFQSDDRTAPVFLLSLRTGGVGLNLTAANHVFHFDRWWNPAVENQATDRAFRIGQTRTVHVHKFVCAGTLEERIDQMIEQKTELAEIVTAGEQWITEMSTSRLREILELRATALEGEP